MSSKKVFITVGTTKFDELITTVLSSDVLKALALKGYNYLTLQIGSTSLKPDCSPRYGFKNIEYFFLTTSLEDHIKSADLIISHAGAGSILEALEASKHLIVVINQFLMNNHQLEVAKELYMNKHLYCCTCETLLSTIEQSNLNNLEPYTIDKSKSIVKYIDEVMGFN